MKNLLQNKTFLIGAGVLLILVLIVGGIFILKPGGAGNSGTQTEEQQEILSLSPDEIGLTLELADSGKEVVMRVENTEGIESIEYELSYNSAGDIPRGAIGNVEVKGGPIEKKITLGTCSDVCHYDEDVSDIKIILKVAKDDGKIYQVEKSLE